MGRVRTAFPGAGWKGLLVPLACALLAQVTLPAFAQAPGEVTGVAVCSESRDCFSWSPVPGATGYRLYRGESSTLAGLLDDGIDSCLRLTSVDPWTGPEVLEPGPHGAFFWYLVTATDATSA